MDEDDIADIVVKYKIIVESYEIEITVEPVPKIRTILDEF